MLGINYQEITDVWKSSLKIFTTILFDAFKISVEASTGRGRSFENRSFEFLSKTSQRMDPLSDNFFLNFEKWTSNNWTFSCFLNLTQPNLLEDTTHFVFHHLTPPVGEPVQIFERTDFERTTYPGFDSGGKLRSRSIVSQGYVSTINKL
jgi:hypothetical protein